MRQIGLEAYRLSIDRGAATLTIGRAETTDGRDLETARLTGWQDREVRTFAGTATTDGPQLLVELHEDGAPLVWRWRCSLEPEDLAPADAVRMPSPDAIECGDEGVWSRPTAIAPALVCTDAEPDREYISGNFVFGADPGFEYLHVNDDCFQGGGLRHIAPGGAIANIRSSR